MDLTKLAEWIAIENGKTRLQGSEYMEDAQRLADYLTMLGWQSPTEMGRIQAIIEHRYTQDGIREGQQLERERIRAEVKGVDCPTAGDPYDDWCNGFESCRKVVLDKLDRPEEL